MANGFRFSTPEELKERLRNRVLFHIGVGGSEFTRETIQKYFSSLCFFKPVEMSIYRYLKGGVRRYKEALFNEAIFDKKVTNLRLRGDSNSICMSSSWETSSYFDMILTKEIWEEHKSAIIQNYQEIFTTLGASFGFMVNQFDYSVIQNPQDLGEYKYYQVDDSDYPGIWDIPLLPLRSGDIYPRVDISYLPGNSIQYDRRVFAPGTYMWAGPDFNGLIYPETLENFNECEENTEFAPGYRRIILWDNVFEYNHPTYRERQWAFRKHIDLDGLKERIRSATKNENSQSDPSIEFKTGKFEHGGTLMGIAYIDKKGRACKKSEAYACIKREMNGDDVVWQERVKL